MARLAEDTILAMVNRRTIAPPPPFPDVRETTQGLDNVREEGDRRQSAVDRMNTARRIIRCGLEIFWFLTPGS